MYEISLQFIGAFLGFIAAAYVFAVVLVIFSARLAPFIFRIAGYSVNTPYSLTASEATSYTLQSFLAVIVGLVLLFLK
ncbi:MAG TPA: hypothetical protein VFE71_09625 [Bacteroidales bacterium]|nr:hypothetical protein [Bacteroidales bacterium]